MLLAAHAIAQPPRPASEAECRSHAATQANEEFMARDSSVRRTTPFQSDGRMRDPYAGSQQQQLGVQRAAREKALYDACVEELRGKSD